MTRTPPPPPPPRPVTSAAAPEMGIEHFSPDMARAILADYNTRNRPIAKRRVQRYTEAMLRGEWQLTGEALIFDGGGNLLNGQHRLTACIEANVTLTTMVVRGVDPAVLPALDTGKARNLYDNLSLRGHRNAKALAQSLYWVWKLLHGKEYFSARNMTHAQALTLLDEEPGLHEYVTLATSQGFRAACPHVGQFAALAHVLNTRQDRRGTVLVSSFVSGLATGIALEAGDPRLVLREKWARIRAERTAVVRRTPPLHQLAYDIRAWNAYYSGRTLTKLQVNRNAGLAGKPADAVPSVRGWRGAPW